MSTKTDVLFYSVAEAARILRVSTHVIYREVKANKIEFIRIGNTIRIPRKEIFQEVGGEDDRL